MPGWMRFSARRGFRMMRVAGAFRAERPGSTGRIHDQTYGAGSGGLIGGAGSVSGAVGKFALLSSARAGMGSGSALCGGSAVAGSGAGAGTGSDTTGSGTGAGFRGFAAAALRAGLPAPVERDGADRRAGAEAARDA